MSSYDLAAAFDYLTQAEVDAIKQIATRLRHNPFCVNIGSGAGTSAIALLEARSDAYLMDIDITPDNGVSQMREAGFADSPRYLRITADSKGVVCDSPIDYLFVDGDHSETGIRGDIAAWLPRMAPGGYVLFHDYWPYPAGHKLAGVDYWPDVRRVVDEVMTGEVVMDSDRLRVYQV